MRNKRLGEPSAKLLNNKDSNCLLVNLEQYLLPKSLKSKVRIWPSMVRIPGCELALSVLLTGMLVTCVNHHQVRCRSDCWMSLQSVSPESSPDYKVHTCRVNVLGIEKQPSYGRGKYISWCLDLIIRVLWMTHVTYDDALQAKNGFSITQVRSEKNKKYGHEQEHIKHPRNQDHFKTQ